MFCCCCCFLFLQLRQIAYEYNNCANDEWLMEMGRIYIYNRRKISIRNYNQRAKECEKVLDWRNAPTNKCTPFQKNSYVGLANSSKFHLNSEQCTKSKNAQNEYCSKETVSYESPLFLSPLGFPTSILDTKNDLRSSENIFNEWMEIDCKMINLSKKLRLRTFQDPLLETVHITQSMRCNAM